MAVLRDFNGLASWRNAENSLHSANLTVPRAGFEPIAKHIVECAGVGVTSSDLSLFDFKKLRRPIYPLDPDEAFAA